MMDLEAAEGVGAHGGDRIAGAAGIGLLESPRAMRHGLVVHVVVVVFFSPNRK